MLIKHTKDLPDRFPVAFAEACAEIGCEQLDLLGVMFSESGCIAHATNGAPYHAVGLIQFMPDTLKWMGWTQGYEAFRHVDAVGQLPYVVRYFQAFEKQGKPWASAGRLYQATFLPGTLATDHGEESILVARDGRLGWAYSANAVFDENGDGMITIAELTSAVFRNCRGARYVEILERLGMLDGDDADKRPTLDPDGDGVPDIVSCLHLQTALERLGFDPGPIDGLFGPKTRAGIVAFQKSRELPETGRPDAELRAHVGIAIQTSC